MDKIDQAIFEHFCQAENFKTAAQIHQHFPKVHLRLVQEFWAAVEKELRTKAKENWQVRLDKPITVIKHEHHLKFGYYFKIDSKTYFKVMFENLAQDVYYGLKIEDNLARGAEFKQRSEVEAKFEKIKEEKFGQVINEDNEYWAIRIDCGFNFSDPSQIEAIFPANRAAMVQEFADNLFGLAEMLEPNIQEFAAIIAKHSSS